MTRARQSITIKKIAQGLSRFIRVTPDKRVAKPGAAALKYYILNAPPVHATYATPQSDATVHAKLERQVSENGWQPNTAKLGTFTLPKVGKFEQPLTKDRMLSPRPAPRCLDSVRGRLLAHPSYAHAADRDPRAGCGLRHDRHRAAWRTVHSLTAPVRLTRNRYRRR